MSGTLDYNLTEMMICTAARLFRDETTCFIGTGIPMLAASLAQRIHTPNIMPIFEFGGMAAILEDLPRAVGEASGVDCAETLPLRPAPSKIVAKAPINARLPGLGVRAKFALAILYLSPDEHRVSERKEPVLVTHGFSVRAQDSFSARQRADQHQ